MKNPDLAFSVTATSTATADHLANTAFSLLCENLTSYGNVLSEGHKAALLEVNRVYSRIALGLSVGRVAVPLDTGMGKTQSVIAFCTALHRLSHSGVGVLICQSKVEALCDLKRQLLNLGVPEEAVGLMHTYKHGPEGLDASGKLLDGYATLPATHDPSSHQILLVSHQRIRGQKTQQFNVFRDQPRSLCVWDESLITSDVQYLLLSDLKVAVFGWGVYTEGQPHCEPLRQYLDSCVETLMSALGEAKAGHPAVVVELPRLSDDEWKFYSDIIKDYRSDEVLVKTRLTQFLDMAKKPVRVVHSQDEGIVQYTINVPSELDRVVVLDASWHIRKLERLDATISLIDSSSVVEGLKLYDNVIVRQLFAYSGRNSLAKEPEAVAWSAKEVAEVIRRDVPLDQGIVIFTFKAKTKDDPVNRFRADLERSGVDLEATIETIGRDGRVQARPRVNVLTWGMHEGLNDFSYCQNVILVGVLRQRGINLMASAIGQKDDLSASVSPTELTEVINGELAHVVFQALGRGSCRMVNNGHAWPMNAWIIHPSIDLQDTLDKVMQGVRWDVWVPLDESQCKAVQIHRAALHIRLALLRLSPEVTSISIRKLRKEAGLEGIPDKTFGVSRERAEKGLQGWYREKNSFHRNWY